MVSHEESGRSITIPARDGYPLAATLFGSTENVARVAIISSATAVPQRFYRYFAAALAEADFTVITYDYRGIELASSKEVKALEATAREWALLDLPGVVDWAADELGAEKLFLVGHSFGDDKWGTSRSVEAMMRAYPNVERRHVHPTDVGLNSIGHLGFFKSDSVVLWEDTINWLDRIKTAIKVGELPVSDLVFPRRCPE